MKADLNCVIIVNNKVHLKACTWQFGWKINNWNNQHSRDWSLHLHKQTV